MKKALLLLELHDLSLQVPLELVLLEHVGARLGLQQRVLFQWCAGVVAVIRLESIDSRRTGQHEGQQGHNPLDAHAVRLREDHGVRDPEVPVPEAERPGPLVGGVRVDPCALEPQGLGNPSLEDPGEGRSLHLLNDLAEDLVVRVRIVGPIQISRRGMGSQATGDLHRLGKGQGPVLPSGRCSRG